MQGTKNRFAGAGAFDDSDDEPKMMVTKTQKKKEERQITSKPVKVNQTKMAEGGFEVTETGRAPVRGGRGGARGGAVDLQREHCARGAVW